MRGVIEIKNADLKGFELTAYFPCRYCNDLGLDASKCDADGFLKVDNLQNLQNPKISRAGEAKPLYGLMQSQYMQIHEESLVM